MSKLRIIQAGWETYTGPYGAAVFEKGISVDHVNDRDAALLANIIQIERLDGTNPSSSQLLLDTHGNSSAVKTTLGVASTPDAVKSVVDYTRDELERIAGEKGINGLREVSDPMGVKSTSIGKLIDAIISKQKGVALDASDVTGIPLVPVPSVPPVYLIGDIPTK